MNVKVKKITFERSVIEVDTRDGMRELIIDKTEIGHSYNDFAEWSITDKQYYDLEELVDNVIDKMSGSNSLNVSWSN